MKIISFLKVAAGDLRVGAVMPSSRWAVAKILANVPERLEAVLEFGPGDGVITERLLQRLDAGGKLLAIEANPTFVTSLTRRFTGDTRIVLMLADATVASSIATEHGLGPFDLVISGIPFSMLTDKLRRDVVAMTYELLKPGGTFLVYQTSPLMVPYLKKKFQVKTSMAMRNVPPYFVMRATKHK